MTTLPALEAALEEAARRHYGKRRRRSRRRLVLAPAITIAGAAAMLLALPGRTQGPAQPRLSDPPIPPATLALSRALTQAPDIPDHDVDDPLTPHAELPAVAEAFEDQTPYPPNRRDTFDWLSTAPGPYDMASIGYARDVRMLVEWRSACIWLAYWIETDGDARQGAGAVLSEVRAWPTLRDHPGNWAGVPARVELQDTAALQFQYQNDCSPWRNRQDG